MFWAPSLNVLLDIKPDKRRYVPTFFGIWREAIILSSKGSKKTKLSTFFQWIVKTFQVESLFIWAFVLVFLDTYQGHKWWIK